jgi:translation elongation factor EF-G
MLTVMLKLVYEQYDNFGIAGKTTLADNLLAVNNIISKK